MTKNPQFIDDAALTRARRRYESYSVEPLSYGTVRDYCDSFDHLRPLATANGDLKDLQRPWAFKAILSRMGPRKGRVLEIGAGEPLVAELLRRAGHEVWVVDPYDGSGNGPLDFERFRRDYRKLHFVRDHFHDSTDGLQPGSFDCIYSISVLEHVPLEGLAGVARGMRRFLRPDGVSLHAVDHVHRGRDAEEHLLKLGSIAVMAGASIPSLEQMLTSMTDDTETYYLSAESHNRWRGGLAYDEFPMRVCVSVQLCTSAGQLVIPEHPQDHSAPRRRPAAH